MITVERTISIPMGFLYLLRGLKLVFSRWGLIKLSIIPFIINTLLFIIFFLLFNTLTYYLSSWFFEQSTQEWYWAALSVLAGIILFIASLLAVIFGFVAVGLIIAGPFNDLLSAAVERELTGKVYATQLTIRQQAMLIMRTESKKMVIFVGLELLLVLLNFIPVIGQILFVVLNPLFISFVMAYEFAGYALDRRALDYNGKRKYISTNLGKSIGFGAAVGITFMIPIIHFMLMPAAVAGGTMLVIENPRNSGTDDESEAPAAPELPEPEKE